MENSKLFHLDFGDLGKGAVVAILSGFALPILAAIQTPGFNILTVDWHAVMILALNGGLAGLAAYLVKNLFTDQNGNMLGIRFGKK